ncbi:MAG TPA: APC family permease [Acidobacteriaceae bacterium]|nr:APC family permease [Acidobacteriaceae bacterium]
MSEAELETHAADEPPQEHHLRRQLRLRDLVLAQVLTVVGSSWVGLAAGLGRAQTLVWLLALVSFYLPMAVAVFYLNRSMPLEGGLYVWARRAFGDALGFMTAWNIWLYALSSIATILFQIPSEMSYMIGPSAASLPESHTFVYSLLGVIVALLAWTAVRGLSLGKWIHNVSGASMILAFALLIFAPFWALLHGHPVHFAPFTFALPHSDKESLALIGQILFASSGLEYIAILAGETHSPARDIGRSVVIATPIVFAMFMLGTGSVLAFHNANPSVAINFVAPIPQTLRLAFAGSNAATLLARFSILLLQIRILGASSYLFTGVTRLPMTAGWDHLAPRWFTRLHPRFQTPANSIYFTTAIVAAMLVFGSLGVRAAEAFDVLNNASTDFYVLAYIAMFAIGFFGPHNLRRQLPGWAIAWCGLGALTSILIFILNAYPFVQVASGLGFATKILGTIIAANVIGYVFYRRAANQSLRASNIRA